MTKLIIILSILFIIPSGALSATIRMEADGSGDYENMLIATISLSDGDTLVLGSGRFETINYHDNGMFQYRSVVLLLNDDITIIGQGVGNTIIGPASGGDTYQISDCSIRGFEYGIATASLHLTASSVDIQQGTNAVWAMGGSAESLNLTAVEISDCVSGVVAPHMRGPSLQIQESSIVVEEHALDLRVESEAVVLDTWLESLNGTTILAGNNTELTIHNGHILSQDGCLRVCLSQYSDVLELDMSGNDWGGVDEDQIPGLIHDHQDDPTLSATVVFSPVSGDPVATENTSWGDLKACFR